MAIKSFRRVEKKYIVTAEQKKQLISVLKLHMHLDPYCKNESTYHIRNIYYDDEHNNLIIKSISKPVFKEKIRMRRYDGQKNVFLEVKKKSEGVVGKRRITLEEKDAINLIEHNIIPDNLSHLDNQIANELNFIFKKYKLKPAVFISYDRLGYIDNIDKDLRITFDNNIHTSRKNISWDEKSYEHSLLDDNHYILEIKAKMNFPLWLARALNAFKIYPHSFSKYGTEYKLTQKGVRVKL